MRALAVAVVFLALVPRAATQGRDDTAYLQARLDAGGTISLPKLANGACYATRGLWVSRDDTKIVSNGACITALGPGEVRLTSPDGDPIAANAVFFVNHSHPLDPTPVRIEIRGLRLDVPAVTSMFGVAVYGHEVTLRGLTIGGSPVDAVTVGGRANGSGFAGRVAILGSSLSGAMRNVVSATSVLGLRIEGNRISGARDLPPGQPAAGIDVEPDHRGAPTLDVTIARNTIVDNGGPGLLVSLDSNVGLPAIASRVTIDRNRILRNGRRPSPPQLAGIVLAGGQDRGGARIVLTNNVVRGNRGPGVLGDRLHARVVARNNDLRGNSGGPSRGVRFARR